MSIGSYLGIEDHLNQSLTIPQVDEDQVPVVSPPVNPSSQDDLLTYIISSKLSAAMVLQHGECPDLGPQGDLGDSPGFGSREPKYDS